SGPGEPSQLGAPSGPEEPLEPGAPWGPWEPLQAHIHPQVPPGMSFISGLDLQRTRPTSIQPHSTPEMTTQTHPGMSHSSGVTSREPGSASKSGAPSGPGEPSQPGAPSGPGEPSEQGAPSGPGQPLEPSAPWGPWEPLEPGAPSGPGEPLKPGAPWGPWDKINLLLTTPDMTLNEEILCVSSILQHVHMSDD
uniref:Uncharacterized protein n=1 Tax=Oryzias melastigma TaxID=30732 RepID=A0A3B3DRP7_ORYME